ncbi:hypothetical protein TPA0909_60920 [Streptomyces albus]|nr:hypothetical protein TPA0909_60920 [Streptomyces albus]
MLERGYDVATKANTIRLYLADPRRAGDVRDVARLHTGQGGVRPVRKTLLADLGDCPDLGAPNPSPQPNPLLDNIEAMAVAGRAHGRLELLLASDDNESAQQVTRLYRLGRAPAAPLTRAWRTLTCARCTPERSSYGMKPDLGALGLFADTGRSPT